MRTIQLTNLYALRRVSDGKFALGGYFPDWVDDCRVFTSQIKLNRHLGYVLRGRNVGNPGGRYGAYGDTPLADIEIVAFTLDLLQSTRTPLTAWDFARQILIRT